MRGKNASVASGGCCEELLKLEMYLERGKLHRMIELGKDRISRGRTAGRERLHSAGDNSVEDFDGAVHQCEDRRDQVGTKLKTKERLVTHSFSAEYCKTPKLQLLSAPSGLSQNGNASNHRILIFSSFPPLPLDTLLHFDHPSSQIVSCFHTLSIFPPIRTVSPRFTFSSRLGRLGYYRTR